MSYKRYTTSKNDWKIGNFMLVNKFIDFSFISSNTPKIYNLNTNVKLDINIYHGVYAYTIGPTYETEAEIKEGAQVAVQLLDI